MTKPHVGFGCMRLSSLAEDEALAVLGAALKAGATLLAVLFATRIALWGLDLMAGQMERAAARPAMNRRTADQER